jgi:hypothetical protein
VREDSDYPVRPVVLLVLAIAVVAGISFLVPDEEPATPPAAASLILTDYTKVRAGDCVRFSGPGEDDVGITTVDCSSERASLKVGATGVSCPRGEYKVLRDTRNDVALCLMPNARAGDCFELDPDAVQSSAVTKFDCSAPRANVRVVGVSTGGGCPEETDVGVPYENLVLCLAKS